MRPLIRIEDTDLEYVHRLYLPGTRCWNVQFVRNSFATMDAEEILKIRSGTRMMEDVLAWAFERNGVYSVRSCYRMLKRESDQKEAAAGNETGTSETNHWWKKLWKLKISPKIRIFWWRAMNNFLPAKGELKRRHAAHEDYCESCGLQMQLCSLLLAGRKRSYWLQNPCSTPENMDMGLTIWGELLGEGYSPNHMWRLVTVVGTKCTKTWEREVEF